MIDEFSNKPSDGLAPSPSPSDNSDAGLGRPVEPSSQALIPVRAKGGRPVLTLEKISRLREMYMGFETIDTIAETLHMSPKTVSKQIHKPRANGLSWAQVREEQRRLVAESIVSNSSHLLQQATDRSIRLLHIGLTEFHKQAVLNPAGVDLKDLEKVASIAERLDRLNRLAAGKATSIHTLVPGEIASKEQTDAIIKNDPFTHEGEFTTKEDPE